MPSCQKAISFYRITHADLIFSGAGGASASSRQSATEADSLRFCKLAMGCSSTGHMLQSMDYRASDQDPVCPSAESGISDSWPSAVSLWGEASAGSAAGVELGPTASPAGKGTSL